MAWSKIRFNGEDSDGCIFTVIAGLAAFTDAKETFVEFCRAHLIAVAANNFNKLYSHYVFSGPTKAGNHGTYPYGPKFAAFLRDEGLGDVVEAKPTDNVKFHAGRLGQVWIWTPDQKSVEAWWKANGPKGAKPNKDATEAGW